MNKNFAKIVIICLIKICFFDLCLATGDVVLVNNTLPQINRSKNKLKLELIKIWGGEHEEDENKFFENPESVAVGRDGNVYICDQNGHCIKEFTSTGDYVRTIGRRGKGPSDLLTPHSLTICTNGDLLILERHGLRLQRLSPKGKSKKIIKTNLLSYWLGITSQDEIALYNKEFTFNSRKLISIIDWRGKKLRVIGQYHDGSRNIWKSEGLKFAVDCEDNFYAANEWVPIIRKYSPGGELLMGITYEVPFEIPFRISFDRHKNDLVKEEVENNKEELDIERTKKRAVIKGSSATSKSKTIVNLGIAIDSQNRIFVVSSARKLSEEEQKAFAGIMLSGGKIIRKGIDFSAVENMDAYRIMVFDPKGEIIATTSLTSACHQIYVQGNKLFIVDGFLNQRVLEYRMHFQN